MITAGIDSGSRGTKVVIMEDGRLLASTVLQGVRESSFLLAEQALQTALKEASLNRGDLERVIVTGFGKNYITFAEPLPDVLCLAKAAHNLMPSVHTIVDIGAEHCLAVKCQDGIPVNTARNEQCAAGTAMALDNVLEVLGVPAEMSEDLYWRATKRVEVVNTCAVFMESDVISLVHMGEKVEDIIKGVIWAIASRIFPLLVKVDLDPEIAAVGGLAQNSGLVDSLQKLLKAPLLVPPKPVMVMAYGAALIGCYAEGEKS